MLILELFRGAIGVFARVFVEALRIANRNPEAWLLASLKERFRYYSPSSDTSENTKVLTLTDTPQYKHIIYSKI